MQNGNICKVFGILTFIFELAMIFGLIVGNRREPIPFEIKAITRMSVFFILTTVTGIGLMYQKKWAMILFLSGGLSLVLLMLFGS